MYNIRSVGNVQLFGCSKNVYINIFRGEKFSDIYLPFVNIS
jgi:hypothetical protein